MAHARSRSPPPPPTPPPWGGLQRYLNSGPAGMGAMATWEHHGILGSTAVPGLAAKPIVDMLIEVTDLQATRVRIAPVLEALASQDILGGLDLSALYPDLGDALLVCATETKTDADVDTYIAALGDIMTEAGRRTA